MCNSRAKPENPEHKCHIIVLLPRLCNPQELIKSYSHLRSKGSIPGIICLGSLQVLQVPPTAPPLAAPEH